MQEIMDNLVWPGVTLALGLFWLYLVIQVW